MNQIDNFIENIKKVNEQYFNKDKKVIIILDLYREEYQEQFVTKFINFANDVNSNIIILVEDNSKNYEITSFENKDDMIARFKTEKKSLKM